MHASFYEIYIRPGNLISVLFDQDLPSCLADLDTHFQLVLMKNENLSLSRPLGKVSAFVWN